MHVCAALKESGEGSRREKQLGGSMSGQSSPSPLYELMDTVSSRLSVPVYELIATVSSRLRARQSASLTHYMHKEHSGA